MTNNTLRSALNSFFASEPLVVFWIEYLYIGIMTNEQKKISLINWITTLEDELILDQMVGFKKQFLDELPDAIFQLLKTAEAEPEENLLKHKSAKDFLK